MKRIAALGLGTKSDADRAKRAYRGAVESIRCLEEIYKKKKHMRDVFSQEAVALRNRLKDYCERLMFLNPVEYGRKAEEVLWRKVFYQIIHMLKHNKRLKVRHHGSLETAYRTHLAGALGYYQHLLFRLQQEFGLSLAAVLDFHMVPDTRTPGGNSLKMWTNAAQEWAQRACHRCLICLGDIARYQRDVDPLITAATAQRFYHQAFMLFPEIGMPHNQLGTLSGSRYFSCEAAYHYLRCLACEKPFDGAQGNLKRLFEKNETRLKSHNHLARDLPPETQRPQDIQRFFVGYLRLMEIFSGPEDSVGVSDLQTMCQQTLQDFNLCMFYEPTSPTLRPDVDDDDDWEHSSSDHAQHLDDDIIFKITASLICQIHLLQTIGSSQVTVATAFLLALFSHTLNHVIIRLQSNLYDRQNPNKLLESGMTEDLHDDASSDCLDDHPPTPPLRVREGEEVYDKRGSDSSGPNTGAGETTAAGDSGKEEGKPQSKKYRSFKLRTMRRRRRRRHSDSSSDMSDMSEDSDLSEGVEEEEDNLSEDSDDDLANYFDCNDSESDMSDSPDGPVHIPSSHTPLTTGETLAPAPTTNGEVTPTTATVSASRIRTHIRNNSKGGSGDWSNLAERRYLADMSSELFSNSVLFLGQNLSLTGDPYTNGTLSPSYNDVMQGKTHVSVPPGFVMSEEARHVADITEKLANFVIETDTEVSAGPTDTEQSGVTDTDDADNEHSSSSATDRQELEQRHLQQVLEVIQGEGLLAVVKVMCDWMMCQAPIITACAHSSQSLWSRFAVLLNFLPHENDLMQHEESQGPELRGIVANTRLQQWVQVFPLTEDIELCQLPPLVDIQTNLDYTTSHRAQLSHMQEVLVRVCALRHFGYFLADLEDFNFSYREDQAAFFGPTQKDHKVEEDEILAQERMRDADTRRNQLMRDMAQLRLQAEVSQLEGCLESSQQPHFPPYAIVDATSLCSALTLVKELAHSARCILIIPLAVIDQLDVQKKDSSGAREAIRWLETEFRRGNRYIRAQKSNETVSSNNQRIFKKRHRDIWYMMEVLGCGRYLARQTTTFTSGSVVVILTAHSFLAENPPPVLDSVRAASQEEEFFQRTTVFLPMATVW
ncbi:nonsense-mediated mRNA decay factor SMG5-like isoform X2 [Babylonia areolata]|uniref:nonsense-mediated mRNA decay factor SMG5-like isoform X2 n=1 Tax=Babylonia areolata TaxID=304850 RepID=UPI003FD2382C